MTQPSYHFLPWVRRGLADRIGPPDPAGVLPGRATLSAAVTVSPLPEARQEFQLYGPGDVIGVDPRAIVRTSPGRGSVDVEPNYLAHIEFDAPDFPWLFTPARSPADDRLRPWCVLVVVDLDIVAVQRGQRLPVLTVPAAAVATELPDLIESWAWAHTQVLADDVDADLPTELAAHPGANVSRIVAARRLAPGKRYAACLVPAFDAGVRRGLNAAAVPPASLAPAWDIHAQPPQEVRLPVYFYWTFATGPEGDFEALARRLRPLRAPAAIGAEPLYIGAAGPELPALAPAAPGATLEMDGALRALARTSATLDDVAGPVRDALRATVNAAAEQASSGASAAAPALGPPLYGAWPAGRHTVADDAPAWLRELNLDPRARAAAGLGAEIEHAHQEDFMQWSWEQVGQILEANRLLSRSRLSLEVLARIHARHIASLPPDRLFGLAAPLHRRVRLGTVTITTAVARSSVPDAAADVALRRLTTRRRHAQSSGGLVKAFAAGRIDVDPAGFVPDGLLGTRALDRIQVAAGATKPVSLADAGLPVVIAPAALGTLRAEQQAARQHAAPEIAGRADLFTTGVPGAVHLERVRRAPLRSAPLVGLASTRRDAPIHDAVAVGRLQRAIAKSAHAGRPTPATPERQLVEFDLAAARTTVVARTDPRVTVPRRLGTVLTAGAGADQPLLDGAPGGLSVPPAQDRVMAAPEIDVPVYEYLAALDPQRFLPGVGDIPEDVITLLQTNPRFVEGLLVGLNGEMSRELLWRRFPAERRGTPFRHFWAWTDGEPDIHPIHTWDPNNGLGANARGGTGGQIALLVRGRLLRRYPNAAIYAWRAAADGTLRNPPARADLELPVFSGVLGTDISFVGFNLTEPQLTQGDGWFFVIQEHPTEPRFGFDEGDGVLPALNSWSEATWEHTGTAAGQHLTIAGNPLAGVTHDGATFVEHAAHLASIALQKPFRIAVHARSLVDHG